MHDAFDRRAVLGFHRHDVAPAALRDDRVLEQPQQVRRSHESIEALLEAGLGGPEVRTERPEPTAGTIEYLAGRADGVLDRGGHIRGRSRETSARGEWRIRTDVGEQVLGRADRIRHRDELDRIERAAELRAPERIADIACAAQTARRTLAEQVPPRRGLVLEALGLAEVRRREKRLGELAARRECGALGQEAADRGELEAGERAFVQRRETPFDPRTYRRQGLFVVACSPRPMRTDRTMRDGGTRGASWIDRPERTRSRFVCLVVSPKARASLPGPASARGAASSKPVSGSAPRSNTAPATPSLSVTTFRQ